MPTVLCSWVTVFSFFLVAASAFGSGAPPTPLPGYTPILALSDEFNGEQLDASKWTSTSPGWPGRQPGLFDSDNVVVSGGALQLWARAARRNASWPAGYDNYTTSAVHSIATQRMGFFEIRWRSGSSAISSSWWFHQNTQGTWTEIDVFESTGVTNPARGGANASSLPSHVHIFELPGVPPAALPARCGCTEGKPGAAPCSKGASFSLPQDETFAAAMHVASLNWTETGVAISLDGVLVNTITSPCLVEAIGMDFDRETMPGWMALPEPSTLPDVPFVVDYVRSWARAA